MNYHNRRFRAVSNSESGQVDSTTTFIYYQAADILWGTYSGGQIRFGTITGIVNQDGSLDFTYQHVDISNNIRTGRCHSVPKVLADGRIRLQESWQWTTGDKTSGESVIEEVVL